MLDVIKLLILNGADVNITERVPNRGFEKHSLINRELCEQSFVGFLKQHDTFYNHVCKVFQQYRIIDFVMAWKRPLDGTLGET
jgi:hypothetical protein